MCGLQGGGGIRGLLHAIQRGDGSGQAMDESA